LPAAAAQPNIHFPMSLLRYLRDAAVFAPCYLLLDWVSYISPLGPFNITPWNPQPGLAIAWMLLGGLVHAPVVFLTIFLADAIIRSVPGGYGVTMLTSLFLTAGYAGTAYALRALLRPSPNLQSLRQMTAFAGTVAVATAVIAAGFVGILHAGGLLEASAVLPGWLRFWVGDAVGILVTAPLLLVVADGERRRSAAQLARRGETLVQVALLGAVLWLIFEGLSGDPSHHFYLLFLPLIWFAVRGGMAGATIAIAVVQIGVVLGIHHASQGLPVIELQALVAALTLTGLYLGVMVDERERAAEGLKHSLRLAAAGEMAGAIAHEVNQPLTALTNYGRSGQLLIGAGRSAELGGIIEKMLAEAQRASEVVRRIRDFFRSGSTQLEEVSVAQLLDAAGHAGAAKAGGAISFSVEVERDLPALLVDRLQIELVLRNLVSNAAESLGAQAKPVGHIALSAKRQDSGSVRIVIADNGPGVSAAARRRIFEPLVSGKSSGMGLGLAVSRAIAEAHGGSLDAPLATHGEFHLVLPLRPAHG
jgi:signal transduction histidine kinase